MENPAEEKNETVCAIATPPGEGGIGIVRISGEAAREIAGRLYRGSPPWEELKSHAVRFAEVIDPQDGGLIDEALFLPMCAPHSYTGEDVVEIQSHGNPLILNRILSILIAQGARLAAPGEFTRRAFLSGRMDLAQAEAVMEMIAAKSDVQHRWALGQLKGRLSEKVVTLKNALLSIVAQIEASIDFSEEDLPLSSREEILHRVQEVLRSVRHLLADYEVGRQIREGFTVVIAGRPNVGKSSLMNHFLQEDRAIVSPIAGTTRDLLRELINLDGLLIKLIDTAGFHESAHPVEREGQRRASRALREADLVLWVLDASRPLCEADHRLARELKGLPCMMLLNKCDLPEAIEREPGRFINPDSECMRISIKSGMGLNDLKNKIKAALIKGPEKEPPMVALLRHRNALAASEAGLAAALSSLSAGLSLEFPAIDLRDAMDALGQITGETALDEILDEIFGAFCIGK